MSLIWTPAQLAMLSKVVDLNGFSAAARALGVPKAAVSRAVADLEMTLGVRVLERTTYGRVLLSPLVPRFLEAFARSPLEVALDAQQLTEGGWDVAIRTRPPADGGLTQRLLGAPPALLCATPAYLQQRGVPARPDDLRQHDLLTPELAGQPEFHLQLARGAQRAGARQFSRYARALSARARVRPARAAVRGFPGGEHRAGAGGCCCRARLEDPVH